jgi:sulfoxide reductase catalytic subunit YedY
MLIRRPGNPAEREVTPKATYLGRRRFLAGAAALASPVVTGALVHRFLWPKRAERNTEKFAEVVTRSNPDADFSTTESPNTFEQITNYNNFYEFGTDKTDPAKNAHTLRPRPWTVAIEGLVQKPGIHDLDALRKKFTLEERTYRFRCVEAWSMVIPWVGFPLRKLLDEVQPLASAKYVQFETLLDPKQMPYQKTGILDWPYREGLRIDEAAHPLTLLAVGLYGETLPNQNGAPLRLVVPWKYGFKSGKSIVKIRFVEDMPFTTWNDASPDEYGFYSNVNPKVRHPRWSQAEERRIGELGKRETLMFNGYAEQVAGLYAGMDLGRWF